MEHLFGTDGIRGRADEFPLDAATVRIIGASLARRLAEELGRAPRLISGRDTRESGARIEAAFHAGAASAGAICESAGVITTPGVAYLTKAFDLDAGIVISASHNPYEDNGIKIFSPTGKKLREQTERAIEKDIYSDSGTVTVDAVDDIHVGRSEEFCRGYIEHLKQAAGGLSAKGMRIVIDCANGAAANLAPELFASLGADVIAINREPDGRNINKDSGSLHLDHLQRRVITEAADLGIAFDGDADRALFVDGGGEIVDGDATLWIMSQYLLAHGKLANKTVVATVMSNLGLQVALENAGLVMLRTKVGDKYVLQELLNTSSEIGGEQSGHIIFPEISLVGDGMMTALLVLKAIRERQVSLKTATEGFVRYPQVLINVPVREKVPFSDVPDIADTARDVEAQIAHHGRLLLRYSGTENLARVMIEGKDQSIIENQANRLVSVIKAELG
jgi:phosphoglucosamine mutase